MHRAQEEYEPACRKELVQVRLVVTLKPHLTEQGLILLEELAGKSRIDIDLSHFICSCRVQSADLGQVLQCVDKVVNAGRWLQLNELRHRGT